jgi:hypothetical protein
VVVYEDALPRKRKNDDYREPVFKPLIAMLCRFLGRILAFSFNVFVRVPLRWLWQATVWSVKAPFRATRWLLHQLNILVNGRMPELETAREREIYRRIRRRFRRRNRLLTHLIAFALVDGALWVQWLAYMRRYSEPVAHYLGFTLVWGFILLLHYLRVRLGDAEDDALEAALEREYERETYRQPFYYEEVETYDDHEPRHYLGDEPESHDRLSVPPKSKRRKDYS